MKNNIETISFNVSKTINIGNFEAIKINYGQSVSVDPSRDIETQRLELIKDCYNVVREETSHWDKLKSVQHVDRNKNINVIQR